MLSKIAETLVCTSLHCVNLREGLEKVNELISTHQHQTNIGDRKFYHC